MIIEVTQKDINEASFDAHQCPIAKALNRKFNKQHAFACGAMVGFEGSKGYLPSKRAIRFMNAFDNGRDVKPAKFIFREIL